jgi:hypothetical protein
MTDATPTPIDLDAAPPDDEPAEHHEHAIMNRRLDEDAV